MSTRGMIFIQTKENEFKGFWNGMDSYVDWTGKILQKHYKDEKNVKDLFKLVNKNGGETRGLCEDGTPDFYDDSENKLDKYSSEKSILGLFKNNVFVEYLYLFKNGEWFVAECDNKKFIHLEQAIKNLNVDFE